MNVLITGGAGFIGSKLALRLAQDGARVTVVDNLSEQIHGPDATFAPALLDAARCVPGDVCDRELMVDMLNGQDVLVHLAAETGTGQSMYAISRYERVNVGGTATLLDILANDARRSISKVVVASSRAVYGEGCYRCVQHGEVYPRLRSREALGAGRFEPLCPVCGGEASVLPTRESAPFSPTSFYGLTKQIQEQMVLLFSSAMNIDGIALRYQNVYGPGQSLNNPYTGILAVFTNLVRQQRAINVFEDGLESRDFVFVDDVVEATARAVTRELRGSHSVNVGSAVPTTVLEVAHAIVRYFDADISIDVSGNFRVGDIRHNVADITAMRGLLDFSPRWTFADGLNAFLDWAVQFDAHDNGFLRSIDELRTRGLMGRASAAL